MKEAYLVLDKAPLVAWLVPKVDIVNLLGLKEYESAAREILHRLEKTPTQSALTPDFPTIITPDQMREFATARLEKTISLSRRLRELQTPQRARQTP